VRELEPTLEPLDRAAEVILEAATCVLCLFPLHVREDEAELDEEVVCTISIILLWAIKQAEIAH
jgi:hypothetical protein